MRKSSISRGNSDPPVRDVEATTSTTTSTNGGSGSRRTSVATATETNEVQEVSDG